MIVKFFQTLDDSIEGNDKARESLEKVGITINDLKNASEQEILGKALKRLGEMDQGARRTALGVEIFGKAFRTVDPKLLDEAFRTGNAEAFASAIKKAADMADAHAKTMQNLETAILNTMNNGLKALEPFIGKVGEAGAGVEQMEKVVKAVGLTMAVIFGMNAITTIIGFTTAMQVLTGIQKTYQGVLKGIAVTQAFITGLTGAGLALVAAAGVAAVGVAVALNQENEETINQKQRQLELEKDIKKWANMPNQTANETNRLGIPEPTKKREIKDTTAQKAAAQLLATAKAETRMLSDKNDMAAKYANSLIFTIGLEEDQASMIKSIVDIEKKRSEDIDKVKKKIDEENAKKDKANKAAIDQYEKQKTLINEGANAEVQMAVNVRDKNQLLKETTNLREQDLAAQQNHLNVLQVEEEAIRNIAILQGTMTQEQVSRAKALSDIDKQYNSQQLTFKSQLDAAEKSSSYLAMANIKKQMDLNTEEYNQKRNQMIANSNFEDERRQSAAAGQAEYLDQLSRTIDPGKIMQDKNAAVFNNMTSALDKFVDTGKLSFGDLTRSIIADLLKIELKASATALFKSFGGFTGLLNMMSGGVGTITAAPSMGSAGAALMGLPAFANGGTPPVNKPSIVGEKGPELFIPRSAGTVVPNHALGGGNGQTINNNTYVTNQISALDSRSVAQLFAENRQTLLGVTEMARKELPGRQRL